MPQVRQEFGSPVGLVNQELGSPTGLVKQGFGLPAALAAVEGKVCGRGGPQRREGEASPPSFAWHFIKSLARPATSDEVRRIHQATASAADL